MYKITAITDWVEILRPMQVQEAAHCLMVMIGHEGHEHGEQELANALVAWAMLAKGEDDGNVRIEL